MVFADIAVQFELHAAIDEALRAALDDVLLEFEVRDAVDEQAADAVVAIVDRDLVAALAHALGGGEAGGAGADDADAFAALGARRDAARPSLRARRCRSGTFRPRRWSPRRARFARSRTRLRRGDLAGRCGRRFRASSWWRPRVRRLPRSRPSAVSFSQSGMLFCSGQWVWQNGTPHCAQRAACSAAFCGNEFGVDFVEIRPRAPRAGAFRAIFARETRISACVRPRTPSKRRAYGEIISL